MKKYTLLNDDNSVKHCESFIEGCQPENAVEEMETENFLRSFFDYETRNFYEGASIEEINEFKKIKDQEVESNKYIQRIKDGQNMYAKISSKFRLAKLNGELDQSTHEFIEETFRPVREEVLAGQWITAFEIVQIIESQFVGSTIFEEIKTTIQNYITENY